VREGKCLPLTDEITTISSVIPRNIPSIAHQHNTAELHDAYTVEPQERMCEISFDGAYDECDRVGLQRNVE